MNRAIKGRQRVIRDICGGGKISAPDSIPQRAWRAPHLLRRAYGGSRAAAAGVRIQQLRDIKPERRVFAGNPAILLFR